MKQKLFLFAILLITVAFQATAQNYDFSAVAPSGQTLYYKIIGNGDNVALTYPGSNDFYTGYTKPAGNLVIPASVTNNGTSYSVTSIGRNAFYDCYGLASVTIPNSVTYIGQTAFDFCYSLTSVIIPNSVTSIGQYAFNECRSLTTVTIPNSVTSVGSGAFFECSGLISVIIPNSVTSIGDAVFSGCSRLTSVTIPNSVTSIGREAFYDCSGLTEITSLATNPPTSSTDAFQNVPTDIPVYVPCDNIATYQAANGWSSFTNIQCISQSVTTDTFNIRTCTGQTLRFEVEDGNHTAKVIGYVGQCTGSLTVPAWFSVDGVRYEVTVIGARAFENCTSLESVILPRSITLVDSEAFKGCSALVTVDMK